MTERLQKRGMPELSVSSLDRHWKRWDFFLSCNSYLEWIQFMCLTLQIRCGITPKEMITPCYFCSYSLPMHCRRYSKHNVGHILGKSFVAAGKQILSEGVDKTSITTAQVTTAVSKHTFLVSHSTFTFIKYTLIHAPVWGKCWALSTVISGTHTHT